MKVTSQFFFVLDPEALAKSSASKTPSNKLLSRISEACTLGFVIFSTDLNSRTLLVPFGTKKIGRESRAELSLLSRDLNARNDG